MAIAFERDGEERSLDAFLLVGAWSVEQVQQKSLFDAPGRAVTSKGSRLYGLRQPSCPWTFGILPGGL